jgi:hypothetical protein
MAEITARPEPDFDTMPLRDLFNWKRNGEWSEQETAEIGAALLRRAEELGMSRADYVRHMLNREHRRYFTDGEVELMHHVIQLQAMLGFFPDFDWDKTDDRLEMCREIARCWNNVADEMERQRTRGSRCLFE